MLLRFVLNGYGDTMTPRSVVALLVVVLPQLLVVTVIIGNIVRTAP